MAPHEQSARSVKQTSLDSVQLYGFCGPRAAASSLTTLLLITDVCVLVDPQHPLTQERASEMMRKVEAAKDNFESAGALSDPLSIYTMQSETR